MADITPANIKKLRACMVCSLLKHHHSFVNEGCDNCENILNLKNDSERVEECTSANYEGVIAVMQPGKSWTARWQRIDKFKVGMYAVQVNGKLPQDVVELMADSGFKYRPRDGSVLD